MLAKNVNELQIQEKQKLKELEKMERQAQNEARLKDVPLIPYIPLSLLIL